MKQVPHILRRQLRASAPELFSLSGDGVVQRLWRAHRFRGVRRRRL